MTFIELSIGAFISLSESNIPMYWMLFYVHLYNNGNNARFDNKIRYPYFNEWAMMHSVLFTIAID